MTQFSRKNAFKTSVRGIKSRGILHLGGGGDELQLRRTQRYLRVCWGVVPLDINAYKTGNVEHGARN
jgi:hypothetical protein